MASNLCCRKHHEWNFLRGNKDGGASRRAPHQPGMLAAADGTPDQAKMMESHAALRPNVYAKPGAGLVGDAMKRE